MQTAKCFEVYTPEGVLICRAYFTEREIPVPNRPGPTPEDPQGKVEKQEQGNGETMTGPQKRLLFRLMAAKSIEGEKAHEELKRLFRVQSLQDVTKRDASTMIEHLLAEKGGNGNGPSL